MIGKIVLTLIAVLIVFVIGSAVIPLLNIGGWTFPPIPESWWKFIAAALVAVSVVAIVVFVKEARPPFVWLAVVAVVIGAFAFWVNPSNFMLVGNNLGVKMVNGMGSVEPSPYSFPVEFVDLVDGSTYTFTDDKWLAFAKPRNVCVTPDKSDGLVDFDEKRNEYWLRSRSGSRTTTVHLLSLGETHGTFTCGA